MGAALPPSRVAANPNGWSPSRYSVGEIDNWAATAQRMAERQLLRPGDDWALSPTYDMLPMLYAPVGGELVARDFAQRALQPSTATLSEWAQAQALAHRFWQAVAQDARVSAPFRAIAQENAGQIGL